MNNHAFLESFPLKRGGRIEAHFSSNLGVSFKKLRGKKERINE
jgi:hypothetical protein